MNYDAVIFDMDGIIFDSEQAVISCWEELAKKYGIEGIVDTCHACTGTNKEKTKEIMLERYGKDFPYDSYAAEASEIFHSRYDSGRLPIKPGASEILRALKENGVKVALASSTRRLVVTQQLRDAGLIDYFDELVCGDMVARSKPEPDIFLAACKALKVEPSKAYAIEDSYNGIRSAYAAGMMPIMVPDLLPPTDEMRSKAIMIFDNLYEVRKFLLEE